MRDGKNTMSFRISDEGREILEALRSKLGVNYSGLLEMGLRRLADQEGIKARPAEPVKEGTAAE